jgi:pentatricopeptide repeat protein
MAVGDVDRAIDAYKTGYAKSASAELALRLKKAYDRKGDPEAGIAALKKWLDKNPEDYATGVILASAELKQGKLKDSAKTFEALYKENRNDPVVLNNLAWIYHQEGDDRALGMATKAYAADKNSAQILDTLGWISLTSANPQDGLDYLRMAAAFAPRSTQIRYHLAVALAKNGRTTEAKSVLDEMLASRGTFPELADARKLRSTLN